MTTPRPAPAKVGSAGQTDEWVTVLEFAQPDSADPFLVAEVESLVEHLRSWQPSALWNPDRYAIQIRIPAASPDVALHWAIAYHREAAQAAGLPPVPLARVEVLTVEELERSWQVYIQSGTVVPGEAPQSLLCAELLTATRSLVAAMTPAEVVAAVAGYITTVGGRVEWGDANPIPGMITVDISIDDQPCHAIADAFSVTGLLIEHSLPDLLVDARRALTRLLSQDRSNHQQNAQVPDPSI